MKKMTSEMATRCELALMGKVIPVNSNDEVNEMTNYILRAIGNDRAEDVNIMEQIHYFTKKNEVKYLVCNTLYGEFKCITYLLKSPGVPAPLKQTYGTGYPCSFCYVFNTDVEFLSEFGDCFFEKKSDGFYHRAS